MKMRRDIEQAKARMSPSNGHWRDIGSVAKVVESTEVVRYIAGGRQDQHTGVLVLTDRRLLYVSERRLLWAVGLGAIADMRCTFSDLFATITVRTHDRALETQFVDSKDAVALVTAAGGTYRRVPREVAIAS